MSERLRTIAARYASALRATESLTVDGGGASRPSVVDIWLWKLEEAAAGLVTHWKGKKVPWPGGYDHHYLYAHRYCMASPAAVQQAPDSVLFEMMGLDPSQELGWLQFIVRELGWHSMIASNWGHPVLLIPDGVTYNTTTEAQRHAQAVSFLREVLRERGIDPLAGIPEAAEELKAKFRERHGRDLDEATFRRWLKGRNHWLFSLYAYGDEPNPPEALTPPREPLYTGGMLVKFAAEIRAAASRRRAVWNATHPEDCLRRERERDREEGLAEERRFVAEKLEDPHYQRWVAEEGKTPEGQLWEGLMRYYGDGRGATGKDHNVGHIESLKLCVFLLANPAALGLLRLPEHRNVALTIRKYLSWIYVPAD